MVRVYLDNNVIVDIEDGKLSLEDIRSWLPSVEIDFIYSAAHLQEAFNKNHNSESEKLEFLSKRFETISSVSNNSYIYMEEKLTGVSFYKELPSKVYQTITDVPVKSIINTFTNFISNDQRKDLLKHFGKDLIINNLSSDELIEHLDKKLNKEETGYGFMEMIEFGKKALGKNTEYRLNHKLASIIELSDLFGFWKDSFTERRNVARMWDSNHAYFGAFCDYFVSNDRNARKKIRFAYDLCGIKTIISDSKGSQEVL